MASTARLGYEDSVPPIHNLLAHGVPSISALDTYIADLDVDLEDNTRELDASLQDLLQLTNRVVGKEYVTPRDALLSMISNHTLERDSCYDPEPTSVHDILTHAAFMLEKVPGSEEAVLQDLLSLSSSQGLSLPLRTAGVDPIASTMSLNKVSDTSEAQIVQQWDQLSMHLRRFFLDRLSHLPVNARVPEIDITEGRRLKYLQSLITLQPVDEVWERYQGVRLKQLEQCLTLLLPETDPEHIDFLHISENCLEVARIVIRMMDEDFRVLNSGMMKKPSSIFQAFKKVYLEKFADEMSALIDEIWDEIRDSIRRGPSQSFSTQGNKGKPKVPGYGTLSRGHAHSLESVVTSGGGQSETTATNQLSIPVKYIKAILNILSTILLIEEHIDNLQKASIWDVGGLPNRKASRKGSLKGVLKTSSSPDSLRRPNSANLSSVDSDSWMSDSMASNSSMLFDTPILPKVTVVEKMKLEDRVRWDWKVIFKKIAPELAHCVEHYVRGAMTRALNLEMQVWASDHELQTAPVRESLWGGRLDYPKVISKAVHDFMEEVEMCVLFARAGTEGALSAVRSSFVDVTNLCLKNFHTHLLKLSADVPVNSPLKNLYVILSSAAYIRNYLLHYDTILTPEDGKKPFCQQYKQFVELVETLTDLLIQRHNNYIATSVLHDTDCNNWKDSKEFYEGERCSFTIQMWHYHLRGLQRDLWVMCPPRVAQTTFSHVLHDSLQILAQRYTQSTPSYRRVSQFKCDILSILLCVEELLYRASNTISKCLDAGHSQNPHYAIHNLCTMLVSALAVIAAPLEVLYKVNKKGYRYRQKRKSYNQADRGCNTNWLSWIQPHIFDKNFKSYDDIRTTTAVYLHTKLLMCQPDLNYPLTLQAYLMKDYTLSILFLTQAATQSPTSSGPTSSNKGADPSTKGSSSPDLAARKQFTEALIHVLLNTTQHTDGLAKVIIPVIDRCQEWTVLDTRHVPGKDMQVPFWMEAIFPCMKTVINRIVKPLADFVLSQSEEKQITKISAVIEELPCGCRSQAMVTPRSSRKSEVDKDLVDSALKLAMGQLAKDIFVLPTSVCVLMKALEQQCAVKGVKTPHHCVGLKLIAAALRDCLLDTARLSDALGVSLNQAAKDTFNLVADCIYHVLVSGKVKSSSTPRLAGKFCKDNRDWINEKLQILICYLNSEIFEITEGGSEDETTEYMDLMYLSVTSDLLATSAGKESLNHLYWLIHNNKAWLYQQLDIKNVLPLADPAANQAATFTLDMTPKRDDSFNPITEYQRIGPYSFDHTAIDNIQLDWERLLQSDLGLSDLGFRALLYNRHEMQDGAFLEEKEKKPVATLKAVFENEPRELG